MGQLALLDRRVITVAGADRIGFLQGLVSNDVTAAGPARAVYAALLTPQGRYLADFFVFASADALLLDCDPSQAERLAARLARFRLRMAVTIAEETPPWRVMAAWGGAAAFPPGSLVADDPRYAAAGQRALVAEDRVAELARAMHADAAAYDRHRLALGLPDGAQDMVAEKTLLLEAGFDALHGISWQKGCYMGQEVTARTRYRGLVKRALLPVEAAGALPPAGSWIEAGGREAGVLHGGRERRAMATLRLDALTEKLSAAGIGLRVVWPPWLGPEAGLAQLAARFAGSG